jgi:hypothetical protein
MPVPGQDTTDLADPRPVLAKIESVELRVNYLSQRNDWPGQAPGWCWVANLTDMRTSGDPRKFWGRTGTGPGPAEALAAALADARNDGHDTRGTRIMSENETECQMSSRIRPSAGLGFGGWSDGRGTRPAMAMV